jgi:hypothetical protein
MKNAPVRKLIADITNQLLHIQMPKEGGPERRSLDELERSWASLVKLIDVGPEPEVRACPTCGGTIMRAATRCMHCWAKSTPPTSAAVG